MDKQEAAETLGEFGPLFHHLGIRIADQYKRQQETLEYFVQTLHSILKTCRDDDRHAILVVIAVSLLDVYHDSTISKSYSGLLPEREMYLLKLCSRIHPVRAATF